MPAKKPKHPGQIIKEQYLIPRGLTQKELASMLGIHDRTVSAIVGGRMKVSAATAVRLGNAFKTSPDLWLRFQNRYDLYYAKRKLAEDKRSTNTSG